MERGAITQLQLSIALADQRISNKRLGQILVERGFTGESHIAACLSQQYGYPLVDPARRPDPAALKRLTAEQALTLRALPIMEGRDGVVCAISDPIDCFSTDQLASLIPGRLTVQIAPEGWLQRAIRTSYGLTPDEEARFYPIAGHAPDRFHSLTFAMKVGDAQIFDAVDSLLERRVSLFGILETEPAAEEIVRMAQHAAKAATPGLAMIHDSLSHDGYRWVVLQPVKGESLQNIIRTRGPRSLVQSAEVVARVAEISDSLLMAEGDTQWIHSANILMDSGGPVVVPIAPNPNRAVRKGFGETPATICVSSLGLLLSECLFGSNSAGRDLPKQMDDLLESCLTSNPRTRLASPILLASELRSVNWGSIESPIPVATAIEREQLLVGSVPSPGRRTLLERVLNRKVS